MTEFLHDVTQSPRPNALRDLLTGYSIEATPGQIAGVTDLAALLPAGTSVYIPFLPGAGFDDTARAVSQLRQAGLLPVPHIAARAVTSEAELEQGLDLLAGAGAEALLLIAGDTAQPAGPFTSTLDILDSGHLQRHHFRRIGFAAHPEGHPVVDTAALDNALRLKKAYAEATGAEIWLVSQFTFDADPIVSWLDRMALMDFGIPVRIGIPGPAKTRALLSFAIKCGIATSARALMRRPDAARLLLGRWTPADLLNDLAADIAQEPNPLIAGIHAFAFGGFQTSAEWLNTQCNLELESVPQPAGE